MKSYTDEALVIKLKQLKESDKLVILFSPNHGRIESVAKGAGKILSSKGSILDQGNFLKLGLYKSKGLDIITEAELIEDFQGVKQNLQSISEVFYILDILDKFSYPDLKDKKFFSELISFMQFMQKYPDKSPQLIAALEMKVLEFAGFKPLLNKCIHCEEVLIPGEMRISAVGGEAGYLCRKHFDTLKYTKYIVPDQIIKIQKYLLEHNLSESIRLNINNDLIDRLRIIQRRWLEGTLENQLKSATFLDKVIVNSKS